ncbi:glycosyltransferase [Sulfitobacter sp. S0837]|uniref:glycosyltransferase n=1 Tax=Sulfitobacter maritimus TaxID=2741719 RepID=UPI001582DAE2|nr:glycosyltransferase [Sulfitobacter maritimus]NUH66148.1 glycosyltransferase [Sulfitobacter maritimus]
MSTLRLLLPDPQAASPPAERLPIGRYLVNSGAISPKDLLHGLALQRRIDVPLGEILAAEGLISRADILHALAHQYQAQPVDLCKDPPDPRLRHRLPVALCLEFGAVPWLEIGDRLLVVTGQPAQFDRLCACMGSAGKRFLPVIAEPQQVQDHITALYGQELAHKAATRVPMVESCRGWAANPLRRQIWAVALCSVILASVFLAPTVALSAALLWATLTLAMTTGLKAAALASTLLKPRAPTTPPRVPPSDFRLPRVSVMVPLYKEQEIASALISRLSRLTYPKSLLQVVLVLEAGDEVTRETLNRTALPSWISLIEVPEAGQLRTKPRALNYALDFCKGSIIGVWDAEDAPEPDQIEQIATRFHQAPDNVACLQGVLDYYNSRSNWMSRCFAIEYASWWRVLLPGVARLGLVVPLGGTTLFFRREILERLGGWDAHNVTEDADLGLRLARHGYVTEILPTVTYEEANCRPWPWVRQRSRWLKGFLTTWSVHMRAPRRLMKDLGMVRFLGVQTLFLATFSQFALAPLLWSLWLTFVGLSHPAAELLGPAVMTGVIGLFILSQLLNLSLSAFAVSDRRHRHLLPYVLTLPFYFALGALAALKALYEFASSPFYWDKTAHGQSSEEEPTDCAARAGHVKNHPPVAPLPASAVS